MDSAAAGFGTAAAAVLGLAGLGALIAFVALACSVRVVHSGTTVLVERWGRYARQLAPGLHFLSPWSEQARRVVWRCLAESPAGKVYQLVVDRDYVDTRVTQLDLPPFSVFTVDRLQASANCVLYFYVSDPHAAVYNLTDLYAAISSIVETTLRSSICTMTLDGAIAGIAKIRADVTEALGEHQKLWGFTLTNFDLQSIDPPAAIIAATQASVCAARTSEQQQRTAEAEAAVREQRALAQQRLREIELSTEFEGARRTAEAKASVQEKRALARQRLREIELATKLAGARGAAERSRCAADAEAAAYAARRKAGVSDTLLVEELRLKAWEALAARQHGTIVIPMESARFFGAGLAARQLAAAAEEV